MNFFLSQFFKQYFKQFPVPFQDFPSVEAHDAEVWHQEQVRLNFNKSIPSYITDVSENLPTTKLASQYRSQRAPSNNMEEFCET
jgi:hypothetical protein